MSRVYEAQEGAVLYNPKSEVRNPKTLQLVCCCSGSAGVSRLVERKSKPFLHKPQTLSWKCYTLLHHGNIVCATQARQECSKPMKCSSWLSHTTLGPKHSKSFTLCSVQAQRECPGHMKRMSGRCFWSTTTSYRSWWTGQGRSRRRPTSTCKSPSCPGRTRRPLLGPVLPLLALLMVPSSP